MHWTRDVDESPCSTLAWRPLFEPPVLPRTACTDGRGAMGPPTATEPVSVGAAAVTRWLAGMGGANEMVNCSGVGGLDDAYVSGSSKLHAHMYTPPPGA
jgi:hypothetical protein